MKAWILVSLAASLAGASPASAQVTIRQYNQPAVPSPYPNLTGGSRAIYTPPPAQSHQALTPTPTPTPQPLPPQVLPYKVRR